MSELLIKLSISSKFITGTKKELKKLLISLNNMPINVSCQVKRTYNIAASNIENGYIIKFYNIKILEFIYAVWPLLKDKFKLKCGFIKTINYKGCIANWPEIRGTDCPGELLNFK